MPAPTPIPTTGPGFKLLAGDAYAGRRRAVLSGQESQGKKGLSLFPSSLVPCLKNVVCRWPETLMERGACKGFIFYYFCQ